MKAGRTPIVGLMALALDGSLGATMVAGAAGGEAVISGCYSNQTGALCIAAAGEQCRPNETQSSGTSWDRKDRSAPPGPQARKRW